MSVKRYVVQRVLPSDEAGSYVKLGGGTCTDLAEANVIGWNSCQRWEGRIGYRVIEVIVALATDSEEAEKT